jgi:DNA-binding transcriptional MocR family regulator
MGVVTIDVRDKTPIYAQLVRGLRAAIARRRLQTGDQLPTVRQLAVGAAHQRQNRGAGVFRSRRAGGSRPGAASVFVAASAERARSPREHERGCGRSSRG